MRTTRYFEEKVLKERPYIRREWCERALLHPEHTETQKDGRIRHWVYIPEANKYLRVVMLRDGETFHNAFFDQDFNIEGVNGR